MNTNADAREEDDLGCFDDGIVNALAQLPSEMGGPSAGTDAAILRMAATRLVSIRRRRTVKRAVFGTLAAAACLTLTLFLTRPLGNSGDLVPETAVKDDPAAIILREVSSLFPGQIRAIERNASGLQLSLTESPTVRSAPAVVLEIRSNGVSSEIITFSGQTIQIMGHSVTIHTSHDGRVILKGSEIQWTSGKSSNPLPDLRISARII